MKCFNWKVIAALAAIGFGIYALAPGAATAALPVLVVAACPLSMLLMMRAMGSMGGCKTKNDASDTNNDASDTNNDEIAQLRAQVAALRAERQSGSDALSGRKSGGEASEASALRAEVADLRERQADNSSGDFRGSR